MNRRGGRHRALVACAACLAALALAWPGALAQSARPAPQPTGDVPDTILVGGEDGYEPFETLNDAGEPEGFHIDLLRAMGDEMGFTPVFDIGDWPERRRAIEAGELDVLGMIVSPERDEVVDFTDPYLIVSHRIYVPRGAAAVETLADLAGRRVVVQRAAFSEERLRELDLPGIDLVPAEDEREALRLLSTGLYDAAVLTEHRSRRILSEANFGALTVSGRPVLPVDYAFAVTEGNDALLAVLNEGLDRVQADGRFDAIYARWFGGPIATAPPPARRASALPWLLIGSAATVLIVGLAAAARLRGSGSSRSRLAELRRHDALTGALNRTAFHEALAASEERDAWMAMVHVDRFRLINDSFGHAQGDAVLRGVAGVLKRGLGEGESVGRVGGDEFAVLLRGRDEADLRDWAETAAERVRSTDFGRPERPCTATVSVGLACGAGLEGPERSTELLRRADAAAHVAKDEGGDRVRLWAEGDARIAERQGHLRWIRELPAALDEGRLAAHWQAIESTVPRGDALPSVELLARMRTAEGELVPAGLFVGAAERYGLADRIDRVMLQQALSWLLQHPEAELRRVHVNVSGRSLGDPRFLLEAEATLGHSRALLDRLCIEVTETALIANLDVARDTLARLRGLGIRIALDDFGVGLSSMSYLKALPVDVLKIDGSFVRDLGRDPNAETMIRSIDRLAHGMGLETIAEFVENDRVRSALAGIGVDAVQGFGVGKVRPLDELAGWLEARRRLEASNAGRDGPRAHPPGGR